ncbi:MAG: HAD-IB family phosphatase [Thermoplasmata archaeon]|nr:HAD-IB family phosphatase [Thermoplasmata archaeon]
MIKLVVFDMDGVLTDCKSSWYFVHRYFNTDNIENIRLFNEGKIDYPTFIYKDVMLWKNKDPFLSIEKLKEIYSKMPLMNGAEETVEMLKKNGKKIAIITGGLDILAEIVSKRLGIEIYYANGLEVDENGIITGRPKMVVNPYRKDIALLNLLENLKISKRETVAIGDGEVDVPMFRLVEKSIAFDPLDESVEKNAKIVIKKKDLREILPYVLSTDPESSSNL